MTEHTLQLTCIGIFRNEFERFKKGKIIPVPNELAAKRKDIEICRGCSDTILLFYGKAVFVEFKAGYNNQQQIQLDFQKDVELLGFEYYVVKTIEQFENLICTR
jgi:hypothetical protein